MEGKILMKNLWPASKATWKDSPPHAQPLSPLFLAGPPLSFGDMNADNVS